MGEMALLKYGVLFFAGAGIATVCCSVVIGKKIGKLSQIIIGVAVTSIVLVLYARFIEPNWIEVNHVKIEDDQLSSLLGPTRIVQITDIHLTQGIGYREKNMIERVNALKPDLILFTGDIIDDLTQLEPARELFRQLKATIGIFGVPGDTDKIVIDGRSLARELWPAGIDILVNETRQIHLPNGNTLFLVGLDNTNTNQQNIEAALLRAEGTHIVIAPTPDLFGLVSEFGSNLLLVGDTHGGQVGISFLIHMSEYANRTPYVKGFFKINNTKMYVNKGIGTKTLPIRFLCRPEIAIFEFSEKIEEVAR